ncbi:MAG: hypothetical protein KDA24_11925 [Deltaproteobacteria bacterium]|nr:hypothetical protein [Deltaproteobacteria bacterium]
MIDCKALGPVALALVAFLTSPGCDETPDPIDGSVVQRIALGDAIDSPALTLVGVTIDAASGQRFVLDANSGIYSLDDAGVATQFLALEDFPSPDVGLRSGWQDFAAMGDGTFALIAVGDGFRLDTEEQTLEQWFCYEPGWMDPEQFAQTSENLAYDPVTDRIFSAPLTLDSFAEDEVTRADVATFDGAGAGDLSWFPLSDVNVSFGGMALEADGSVLLATADLLFRYTLGETALQELGSLSEHGIEMVQGMMIDPATGHLQVLDGSDNELVVLDF